MINVGIIGLGKMGLLHCRNCRHVEGVQIVAGADNSKRGRERAEKEHILRIHDDYGQLLEKKDIDAVIIALPNHLHYKAVKLAVEFGKHIFVEKPLANSSDECRSLATYAREKGVSLMVGHNFRFLRAVEKLNDLYQKGFVGDVEVATLDFVNNGPFSPAFKPSPIPSWYFDSNSLGMGCLDTAYHLIDLFNWFFGPCRVQYCDLNHRFNLPYEDKAIILLESQNSSTNGIVNSGWYSKIIFPKFNFRMTLHGTEGFVSTDNFVPKNLYIHAAKEATKNILRKIVGQRIHPLAYTYYYESYVLELEHFFKSIARGTEPSVGAMDSALAMKIIEDAYIKSGETKNQEIHRGHGLGSRRREKE